MTYKKKSPEELITIFLSNAGKDVTFVYGNNPFTVRINGALIYVYIKNLSPAQLSNNNPDIWRIQLPERKEFDKIKSSKNLFILLGYDDENDVFTSWNPYWCKQRLNVGKSVSLYSRLSLQQEVNITGTIKFMELNNDSDVVCIPSFKITDYIMNIKDYYPEETEYVAKTSSLQPRTIKLNTSSDVFKFFKDNLTKIEEFKEYMVTHGVSFKAAGEYKRYLSYLEQDIYIEKYKYVFLSKDQLIDYIEAVREFTAIEEIKALNTKHHGYFNATLNHYINFLTFKAGLVEDNSLKHNSQINLEGTYELNEFNQLVKMDIQTKKLLSKYILGVEYPDYGTMIDVACTCYPKEVSDNMNFVDWIKLFEDEDWKHLDVKSPSKTKSKILRVTRPDGSVIENKKAVDTYETVIKENNPGLIMTLNIKHAGINIISRVFDEKYANYQKEIGNGFILLVNTTTEKKYEHLRLINKKLHLGLKVALIDKNTNQLAMPVNLEVEKTGRKKIKVTLPDGSVIEHNKVLQTLLDVVEYAGPEQVYKLNINVCYFNIMLRKPLENYERACKPINDGWYVNTCSDTNTKYEQIREISNKLNLGLKVELV